MGKKEKSMMLALLEMLCSARIVNICLSINKTYTIQADRNSQADREIQI